MRKYVLSEKKSTLRNNGMKVTSAEINNGLAKLCIDSHTGDITSYIYKGTNFVNNKALLGLNSFRYLHAIESHQFDMSFEFVKINALITFYAANEAISFCCISSIRYSLYNGFPAIDKYSADGNIRGLVVLIFHIL